MSKSLRERILEFLLERREAVTSEIGRSCLETRSTMSSNPATLAAASTLRVLEKEGLVRSCFRSSQVAQTYWKRNELVEEIKDPSDLTRLGFEKLAPDKIWICRGRKLTVSSWENPPQELVDEMKVGMENTATWELANQLAALSSLGMLNTLTDAATITAIKQLMRRRQLQARQGLSRRQKKS